MSINGDYPHPVTVNGFSCKNCTDVDYAKKHIDPSHPKSGPYNISADSDPSRTQAVTFGGALRDLSAAPSTASITTPAMPAPGQVLNITV
ncbi:hypothetical protein AEAC466_11855 [Asticcacaulis sp. AC466]|uniref:hypothetical protein n=1 Tax=Asticcacaulis sp. AC466 TaxID=1282362 RepID=UPI0003C40CD8|nr:hypothetical protein [Asticcacaulis sp. AC466]ESQ83694.1 hypothetical protein AEAC466_11855 [Asticcacaulis sp. AC466]